jgi:hypothetical protein
LINQLVSASASILGKMLKLMPTRTVREPRKEGIRASAVLVGRGLGGVLAEEEYSQLAVDRIKEI